MSRLTRAFFARDARLLARDLLGRHLVHIVDGQRIGGCIVETEAYRGVDDVSAHWNKRRNLGPFAVVYGPPGVSLVYFTYGMHWLFNVVAEPQDQPGAVLIRAIEPLEGLDIIAARRSGRKRREWTAGPARLTMALGIGSAQHGIDLTAPRAALFFAQGAPVPDAAVAVSARIGLNKSPEPWKSLSQRYYIKDNHFVSR